MGGLEPDKGANMSLLADAIIEARADAMAPGVYTTHCSIAGGVVRPLKLEDPLNPPIDSIPSNFGSPQELMANFPGYEFNFIDRSGRQSTKVVAPISEDELAGEVAADVIQLPVAPRYELAAIPESVWTAFMLSFRDYELARGKKKELLKEYCNGMAKVIRIVHPEAETRLKSIVQGRERCDDLL